MHICLIIAAFVVCGDCTAVDEPIGAVAVTENWDQLLAQPQFEFDGGVKARFGIEAATGIAGSGVVIYCLAEGFTPPLHGSGSLGNLLGPVRMHLAVDGVPCAEDKVKWEQSRRDRQQDQGIPLFGQMIALPKQATYTITIASMAGRSIAIATIRGVGEERHPWGNFGVPSHEMNDLPMEQDQVKEEAQVRSTFSHVGFSGFFRAIPRLDGLVPFANWRAGPDGAGSKSLPRLLPAKPDPRLVLSRQGGFLVIDNAIPMEICGNNLPFLVRWWVNDQPLVPNAFAGGIDDHGGMVQDVTRIRLDCELDQKLMGAKAGDRIGVQVLYCPSGWAWPGMEMFEARAVCQKEGDPAPAMLSNRLDFLFP